MALSASEKAVYDRQIRLWGVEAQRKLRASSVLAVGLSPAVSEACKNLVLSGVGSLTLLDDGTPLTDQSRRSNVLAAMGAGAGVAAAGEGGAEASLASVCLGALKELNPMVTLSLVNHPGPLTTESALDVCGYSAVVMGSVSPALQGSVAQRCRGADPPVAFISVVSRGAVSRIAMDLVRHSWRGKTALQTAEDAGDFSGAAEEKSITFPPFSALLASPLFLPARPGGPKETPRTHSAFQVVEEFLAQRSDDGGSSAEAVHKEFQEFAEPRLRKELTAPNAPPLRKRRRAAGSDPITTAVQQVLGLGCSMLGARGSEAAPASEAPAAAAILGGMAAQELIRYLGGSQLCINNTFYFDCNAIDSTLLGLGNAS